MESTKRRVAFYTLGCKLNFSETSTIARQFESLGFEKVSPETPADIYVINTCSVTEHADKKCRQAIRKFITKSPDAFIAVVGCYAQLKPEEIANMEGVDLVLGSSEKFNIPTYITSETKKEKAKIYSCDIDVLHDFFPAYSSNDRTRSFLKVQDGCNYHCSYCTIPLARGHSRNMPISKVVEQATEIASKGIKEVILTGVNTGDFGKSTDESFLSLIQALEKVNGIERYRISSIEPNLITDEIIEFCSKSKKFLPHFHIPLQSGSNRILGLMKRRYNREIFAERLKRIRSIIPNTFIGIDVIVGFPGESDDDFMDSYNFLQQVQPSFLHIFPYSERPNTPAIGYEGKVKATHVKHRIQQLTKLSENLHHEFYLRNIGVTEEVLFESTRKGELMFGFTRNYIKVESPYDKSLVGQIVSINLSRINQDGNMVAEILKNKKA
ncbi:MAG: tRNA (N(6)-L-threonylcarbamoyladenosine(37)-C(2))-methylthiotransferase MtaB [Bacteroidales bacterium]|nr:MAG: tRNA (N(6)-L-threonylcarbamoyladenosine(37)-C(2))-methylthiotransferase MtaB [Bacteroidales bacterium]